LGEALWLGDVTNKSTSAWMKPELGAAKGQGFIDGPEAKPVGRERVEQLGLLEAKLLEAYLHFRQKKNLSYPA